MSFLKRTPVGLADVAALARQACLDLAVQCGCHQSFPAILPCRVHDQAAVGCKTWAFVGGRVGNRIYRSAAELHDLELEDAVDAGNVGEPPAVRAKAWRDVVTPRKGDALRAAASGGHAIDLRRAAAVAHEV